MEKEKKNCYSLLVLVASLSLPLKLRVHKLVESSKWVLVT